MYCGVSDGCGYVIAQQIVGCVACVAWAALNSGVLIAVLGRVQLLRVDLADEMAGLDSVNHGGAVNMSPVPVADSSSMPVFDFAAEFRQQQQQQKQQWQQQPAQKHQQQQSSQCHELHQQASPDTMLTQLKMLQQQFRP